MLEWYIDIANEKNLSLVDITLFPMAVDHRSFTVHTSVCNMWSSYIDRLNVEGNKGRSKCVNHISARCMQIINRLVRNYLNGGDNVECHDSLPRKRVRMNKASLVPKSVFIESSINSSSEEIPSSTSSVLQVPEFGERKCKDGVVKVQLWSVFHCAFLDVKIKTKSTQVVDGHQRMMKVWGAWGTQFSDGNSMDLVSAFTHTNPRFNITLEDNSTWYHNKPSATAALIWYNLTQGADAQWRKRWFRHLLGSESSVLLSQSLFDKEDAVVHLSVV